MDTKKFQRATEIMNELRRLHESLENLKSAYKLTFHTSKRVDEEFGEKSQIFIVCSEAARYEIEMRIARLEKEFNEL